MTSPAPTMLPSRAGRVRLMVGAVSVLVVAVVAALTGPADLSLGASIREMVNGLPFVVLNLKQKEH